jgi:hypothetical protein
MELDRAEEAPRNRAHFGHLFRLSIEIASGEAFSRWR